MKEGALKRTLPAPPKAHSTGRQGPGENKKSINENNL